MARNRNIRPCMAPLTGSEITLNQIFTCSTSKPNTCLQKALNKRTKPYTDHSLEAIMRNDRVMDEGKLKEGTPSYTRNHHLTSNIEIMKEDLDLPRFIFDHRDDGPDLEKQQSPPPKQDDLNELSPYRTYASDLLPVTPTPTPTREPDVTYPEGGLRAWLVVLGSFSGMVVGFGLLNTVGTLEAYLSKHQLARYDPSSRGWVFSIFIFLSFFCGLQIGPIFDAKGPRWLVFAGSVCLLAGTIGLSESRGSVQRALVTCLDFSLMSG